MSLPWWAFPGNKVVCVNDRPGGFPVPGFMFTGDMDGLTSGVVYTIREVCRDRTGAWVLRLVEIERATAPRGQFWGGQEPAYAVARFKPVITDDGEIETAFYLGNNRHANAPRKRERA